MGRVVVTGAAGFVGSHLVRRLARAHDVVAVTRSRPPEPAPGGPRWVRLDLAAEPVEGALPDRCDAVVHLAQSRFYRQFPERADDIFAVNVEGTFRMLEYARRAGASHFVLASSGGIYGTSYEQFTERHPVHPLNFYLTSKYAAELMTANYQALLRTVVFRFFFVYGPGQRGMLVPRLAQRVLSGETIQIEGDPGLKINPIAVSDAVRVFEPALCLDRSDVFNVAGDESVTLRELVARMERIAGRAARVEHVPSRSPGDLLADNTRMKERLGVVPETALDEGLAAVLGDLRSAPAR